MQSELQRFWDEYSALTSVLLIWNVASYGRQDDEEILVEVLKEAQGDLREAVTEGREFLRKRDFSWKVIKETANYSQPYESWMQEWLIGILERIEVTLVATEPSKRESLETATE